MILDSPAELSIRLFAVRPSDETITRKERPALVAEPRFTQALHSSNHTDWTSAKEAIPPLFVAQSVSQHGRLFQEHL